jgi:hypothetical protein
MAVSSLMSQASSNMVYSSGLPRFTRLGMLHLQHFDHASHQVVDVLKAPGLMALAIDRKRLVAPVPA